jgi:hypothetical protein
VRLLPIHVDYNGIFKPVPPTQDIYVLVRAFLTRSIARPEPLPDAIGLGAFAPELIGV